MAKKRAVSSRRKTENSVKDDCNEYRASISEFICEVYPFLIKQPEIKSRIEKQNQASYLNNAMQIHHIYGRSPVNRETEWFCSLVQVTKSCHDAGHDFSPHALEICSLMTKIERHEKYLLMLETGIWQPEVERRIHWNPQAIAKICGSPSLAGRIEGIVLPSLYGTVFERMCETVLNKIETL